MMQIVFIGLNEFSYYCLQQTIKQGGKVVGILTKKKSEFNSDFKDLTPLAKKYEIPIYYIEDVNSDRTFKIIQDLSPEIIFCFGWSQLIRQRLLKYPEQGVIGVHPAKLPYNRGRHPLIWALVLGLKKSALTFFKLDGGTDTGDIISQKEFMINYEDDARDVYQKIKSLAGEQIKEFLPKLKQGTVKYTTQDKNKGNYWRKRGPLDGGIDWRMSSRAIYNLVRGLTHPYVGAHCLYKGEEIKVWKVKEVTNVPENLEPGKVLSQEENSITVKTYQGAVKILEHDFKQLPGVGDYLKW
jgi:methionyl-tRNA formyltransferase